MSLITPSLLPPSQRAKLLDLLQAAGKTDSKCYFHDANSAAVKQPLQTLRYAELYRLATSNAARLTPAIKAYTRAEGRRPIVLLHFKNMQDNIVWFWSSIAAGLHTAVSTPLPASPEQSQKHLAHVARVFQSPLVLTTVELLSEVDRTPGFHITTIEQLTSHEQETCQLQSEADPNIYMLTSGSSGNAKAVELQSSQVLTALAGKHAMLGSQSTDVFLNWIGFDHVANLTECHLHAMALAADQHHVPAADVISDPVLFLTLIDRYRVTATFAPNFFISRLCNTAETSANLKHGLDLSCLRRIASGGEANLVETTLRLDAALQHFGARPELLVPGFGMTETCAGCIYSIDGLHYDAKRGLEFASLGKPAPGTEMRILRQDGSAALPNELGTLHLQGPSIFKRYLNNIQATEDAFPQDGLFCTGDQAFLDENNKLYLSGRDKETINIDGQKYAPHELESALEDALGQGSQRSIVPSYTMVFSVRPYNAQREEICVIYHPAFSPDDVQARVKTADEIIQIIGIRASARPKHIIALPTDHLPKSTLGKLPRAKLRTAFLNNSFHDFEDSHNQDIRSWREQNSESPSNPTESAILEEIKMMALEDFDDTIVGVNNSIFDLGITSTDLFLLSKRIQNRLELDQPLPVGIFFTDPTIRGIASSIRELGHESEYVPIVPLQREGNKTPLFLVHPGSGDVLIFVGLSKYFTDRPVYGIRTRCLYSGTDYHETIHSMAKVYYDHIKKIQPKGPYAIAGYSLGSSVAFEIGKLLEADGSQVPFLGVLDSPPHIKHLIGTQDFIDVLLNVSYFLELISADYAMVESLPMHTKTDSEALDLVLQHAPPHRLKALSIDKERLRKITEVTKSFGTAGRDYDPSGSVANMDVFWVHPLLWVAPDRKTWRDEHLSHWVDFVRSDLQYHECRGSHSLMLNYDQLDGTARKIRSTIRSRGL